MLKDYFDDIKKLCRDETISFYEWKDIRDDLPALIKAHGITSCIAISWRYLLPLTINDYLEDRLIVFHDSLLPKYRGFTPLVTAMLHEDKRVGASVLFATEEADRGEIIMQESFEIDDMVRIQQAIEKMAEVYSLLAEKLMSAIVQGSLKSTPQNEEEATYSIWRDEEDYWIDWRWTAQRIQRFVNALGYPYKGAKTTVGGTVIRILECSAEDDKEFAIRAPGKIWSLCDGVPTVVCGRGLLRVEKALDEEGNTFQFQRLRERLGGTY